MFRSKPKRKPPKEAEEKKKVFSSKCEKHPEIKLDVFCADCDNVYCNECLATNGHERYKNHRLQYITDVAYVFEDSKEFHEYDQNIYALRKKIDRSIEKTSENMKLSDQLQQKAERMINNQKEALIKCIETHYVTISETNKKKNEDCLASMKETLKKCNVLKTQFEDVEYEINEKRKSKITDLFIAIKKSREEIKRIDRCIGTLNQRNNVTRYCFKAGEKARTYMKEIEDFGKLVDENLNFTEEETDCTFSTVDRLDSTVDDNRGNYFQRSRRSTYQRSYSALERCFESTPGGTTNMLRCQSEIVLPILSETASKQVKRVRDPSPQDYVEPELIEKLDSLEPPKLNTEPTALLIEQSTERHDRGIARQTQLDLERLEHPNGKPLSRHQSETCIPTQSPTELHTEQEMYKVLYPYESDDETYLSCQEGDTVTILTKGTGVYWEAKLNGRVGFIRKDYLEDIIESGPETSVNLRERDTSPQDFSCEQTIENAESEQSGNHIIHTRKKTTVPPKLGPKPSTQAIKQAKESKDHGFSRQTREKPVKYKALVTYTSHYKEYLSIKKEDIVTVLEECPGDVYLVELKGQRGYVKKDHLKELSELEIKLLYRKSIS